MMYYLSICILLIALFQAILLAWKQISVSQHNRKVQALELKLLQQKLSTQIQTGNQPIHQTSGWEGWRKFRVDMVVNESPSIRSYYLIPHDGKSIPGYLPGQHLTFKLKIPGASKPVVRCYSLSDSGERPSYYRVTIKKQTAPLQPPSLPNGVASGHFHENIERGDVVDVRSPSGKFYLDLTEKSPIVLIAGGIGLTPSLCMLNTLVDISSAREIWLFYGVNNGSDLIMQDHFRTLTNTHRNIKVRKIYSNPSDQDRQGTDYDHRGHITVSLIQQSGAPMDADYYICGPPGMMEAMFADLNANGVDQQRIHFESFGPASIRKVSGQQQNSVDQSSGDIPVTFGLSGINADWNPQCGSLLELAESKGALIESGCRAGSCGTCLTAILEGTVDYIDSPGLTVESGSCLPCIAVPNGKLILNA